MAVPRVLSRAVWAAAAGLLAFAATAEAEELSASQALSRLDGCLKAGSSGVTSGEIGPAIASVRALCTSQIHRVRDKRFAEIDAGLSAAEREKARRSVLRKLNDEIAYAIANYTGLYP